MYWIKTLQTSASTFDEFSNDSSAYDWLTVIFIFIFFFFCFFVNSVFWVNDQINISSSIDNFESTIKSAFTLFLRFLLRLLLRLFFSLFRQYDSSESMIRSTSSSESSERYQISFITRRKTSSTDNRAEQSYLSEATLHCWVEKLRSIKSHWKWA